MANQNRSTNDRLPAHNQDLENWLPITASREAKWWYSAFHNVTATVGAGVLGLPYAISQLGWTAGVIAIVVSFFVTLYTFWQLTDMHESGDGVRYDRYAELGQHALGKTCGFWIVVPQQTIVQVASNIVYMVTGGKSLKKSAELLFPEVEGARLVYFILFFASLHFILSQLPNFNSLRIISLTAAVMSVSYSMIAMVTSVVKGQETHAHVSHDIRAKTTGGVVFDAFNGLGTIAFAFAGHSVGLEIQATIPSTTAKPSKEPMFRGVLVAYVIVAICYFGVSISGFWAFGNTVDDDVLITLQKPTWVICVANFMVFLHVLGSYQVFAMPIFDMIESRAVRNYGFKPRRLLRVVARSLYVVFTALVACCFPFFGGLIGFFGGFAFTSISYTIPSIMWLILRKPPRFSLHWIASLICIFVGVVTTIVGPIGGVHEIVQSAKQYHMFA